MFNPITYPVFGSTTIWVMLGLAILGHWVVGFRRRHHRDNRPTSDKPAS